jgi:hypothetical protein
MTEPVSDYAAVWALLERLLVGAGHKIDSAERWAARLDDGDPESLAGRFVTQLRAEWPDVAPPDAFCAQVADQVRERLAAWHSGWPHLWSHVLRVTANAVALAEDADVDPALAYLLGMCHDVAKLDEFETGEAHEIAGAIFAGEVLAGHLPPVHVASIQAAIRKKGDEPLAHVLHDADKLDKIGAAGMVRRVSTGLIRSEIAQALLRVMQDASRFPPMHFETSRAQAASKQAFGAWFMPLVGAALRDG